MENIEQQQEQLLALKHIVAENLPDGLCGRVLETGEIVISHKNLTDPKTQIVTHRNGRFVVIDKSTKEVIGLSK